MFDPTELSRDVKRALVILAVGHLCYTGIAVGGAALDHGDLAVDVALQDVATDGTERNVTALTLSLTSHEDGPVAPIFRVHSQIWHIQNRWPVAGGTPTLHAGDTVTVTITAPGEQARPCWNDRIVVSVLNKSTQERAVAGPVDLDDRGADWGRCR